MHGSPADVGASSHETVGGGDVVSGSTQAEGEVDPLQALRDASDESVIPNDIAELLTPEVLRDADEEALEAFLSDLIGASAPSPIGASDSSPRSAGHSATQSAVHSAAHSATQVYTCSAGQSAATAPATPAVTAPVTPVAQPIVPIAQVRACATAPVVAVVAPQRKAGSGPVVVVAPSRGGKRREVERFVTTDTHLPENKRAKEASVDNLSHEGGSSSEAGGSSSANASGAQGCASSGKQPAGKAAASGSKAPAREPCPLCGSTMRGYGRGYCSNKECRERSTLVVRYHTHTESAPAKPSKTASSGEHDDADHHDDPGGPGSLAALGAHWTDKRASPAAPSAPPTVHATPVGSAASALVSPPPLDEPPPSYESLQLEAAPRRKDDRAEATLLDAYILGLGLGWLGLHWFYLGRYRWGVLYLLTFGLLGVGYAIDLLRMPLLVRRARHGWPEDDYPRHIGDTYVLLLSPLGVLFGMHHWYLGRKRWALWHCCTIGFLGVGWVADLFRLPCLVRQCNRDALAASSSQQSLVSAAAGLHASAPSRAGFESRV